MLSAKLGGKFDKYITKLLPKNVSPNTYTLLGLIVTIIASLFLAFGYFILGGLFIFLAGFFDMADGAIARTTGRVSEFGGFLDSVIDRYADLLFFFALCFHYYHVRNVFLFLCTLFTIAGSILTSYVRARAEVFLNQKCNVGIIERPERILFLGVGGLFDLFNYIIPILAILSNLTVFQRIYYVWKKTEALRQVRE
ncbi:MAG TPA: CDP-alcohol phosphatidyltransferase family protein [Candidatus Desulfofervidus auxilii]|uniref:CDP-alcohol phosphatidyltransferase family protein n=1 Tax=Desulfofervidus auxilii TaxID=1621989 RepID=A0A7V0IAF6_DESA2|nr:CDP-alcohol phosphatidyltransferase family protein [Candidatus Desulfofervidus auxilii]